MSQSIGVLDLTFTAGEDLSGHQYSAVKLSADQTVIKGSDGAVCIGVLQNKPTSGQAARVRVLGTSKVHAGAQFDYGVQINSGDADGYLITAAATEQILGIALETAAAKGNIVEAFVCHGRMPA